MVLAISFEVSAMEVLAACKHEFSAWKLVKKPTCNAEAVEKPAEVAYHIHILKTNANSVEHQEGLESAILSPKKTKFHMRKNKSSILHYQLQLL